MKNCLSLAILLVAVGAAQAGPWWFWSSVKPQDKGCCWCPDDYCPKPLPLVRKNPQCCLPDDCCRKELPPAPCRAPVGGCDDYCGKPWPAVPKGCEPWYKCVPACAR